MTETNKKHTPGPWNTRIEKRTRLICDANGNQIAAIRPVSRYGIDGDDAANARLIVAAPDLLGAARFALAYLEDHASETSEGDYDAEYAASCDAAVVGLRAAIAKAEGR